MKYNIYIFIICGINTKENMFKHIISKLLKDKSKGKILKAAIQKQNIKYKRIL